MSAHPASRILKKTPSTPEWKVSQELVDYPTALAAMESRVEGIIAQKAGEMVWLLEHPPLYTAGTSARSADLLDKARFPVYATGRGGQFTYHGPGQRVAYVMFDLKRRNRMDVRAYVRSLEQWIIATLRHFGLKGQVKEGRIGVWVEDPNGQEAKIAALGIRIRKWVTYHGIALNVQPDLTHYDGIVPCGIRDYGVTSLAALGIKTNMSDVDAVLKRTFGEIF